MSGEYSDEPLVRPFLNRGGGSVPALPAGDGGDGGPTRAQVRPYLMTGGRTAPENVAVAMETVVVTADGTLGSRAGVAFEHSAVLDLCQEPLSVAEVAARLEVPLVVALVVVGDLVTDGLLDASTTTPRQSEDVTFLERLIHGVSAL